ncbi:MAG: hypothetical protein FWC26_14820 [Fibromonadales bacterium]|nr:hypothetical protein [Fibromonadales bacterium]
MYNYKARIQKRVSKLVKYGKFANKRIVLFGASVFSKDILTCLQEFGYSANAIVDNDSRKIGTYCLDMIVQKPEDVLIPFDDNIAILFYSVYFYREITVQLKRMGYKDRHHIFVMNLKTDDSLLIFAYMTVAKIRGWYWRKKITKGHSQNCKVFIAPYTGTGDIYLAGLFFNEYVRINNITDYVFAVISNACKKIADMFCIKNVVLIPHQISDDIISLEHATDKNLNIITLNDGWLNDPLQWLRGYKGLNFEKMFRYFVFGFDDSVPHELPPQKDYNKEINALFEKYSLIKGKTVVLSPYSNTLFDLPSDVLQIIVAYCKEHGFTVCTNCAGTEKPVENTIAVFFPLNQAIAFMEAAGYFIGVRSGLCDVISSAKCKKVVLYEKNGLFYKSSQYEYFSLARMGLCNDAVELEYSDNEHEKVIKQILKVFP